MIAYKNMHIKLAAEQDICKLVLRIAADPHMASPPNDPERDLWGAFNCSSARVYIACVGDEVISTLTASWNGRHGETRYLWTAPEHRGSRLARDARDALFTSAFEFLKKLGAKRVMGFVRPGHDKLIAMYERDHGFTVQTEIVVVVRDI